MSIIQFMKLIMEGNLQNESMNDNKSSIKEKLNINNIETL